VISYTTDQTSTSRPFAPRLPSLVSAACYHSSVLKQEDLSRISLTSLRPPDTSSAKPSGIHPKACAPCIPNPCPSSSATSSPKSSCPRYIYPVCWWTNSLHDRKERCCQVHICSCHGRFETCSASAAIYNSGPAKQRTKARFHQQS
jgi:hypothetical protein